MKKKKRRAASMQDQYEHSHQHKGDTGMYGDFFTEDVGKWAPQTGANEIIIVPFQVKKNSIFREANPDLNKPFTKEALKSGKAWAYKLTILWHRDCGPNKETVICPRTIGQECARCDRVRELRAKRKELKNAGKAYGKVEDEIRELAVSKRCIYNLFSLNSRQDRKAGVQTWASPASSIENVLISRARDKETGEFRDFAIPEEGYKVYFEYDRNAPDPKNMYSEVDVLKVKKDDDVDDELIEKLYEQAHVLDDIVEVATPEDMERYTYGTATKGKGKDEEGEEGEGMGEDNLLEQMSRKELKQLIKEEELEVKVYKSMSDDDIRDAIREARPEPEEEEPEEEEEEEEESEEEDEEEEEEGDDLDEMDRKELKGVIKEEDLDIKVLKKYSDDDLRALIRDAREYAEPEEGEQEEGEEEEGDDDEDPECFGIELGQRDECEDCPEERWERCHKEFIKLQKQKKGGKKGKKGKK